MTYTVTLNHQGQTYTFPATSEQTILEAAREHGVELPSACEAGVCTTCAGQILKGEIVQSNAMGIAPDLKAKGYALFCVASARSDLEIVSEKEDDVYNLQFGSNR